jgi:hypothetical protein
MKKITLLLAVALGGVAMLVAAVAATGDSSAPDMLSASDLGNVASDVASDRNRGPLDTTGKGLSPETIQMLQLDASSIVAVGSYPLGQGRRHEVYLARNNTGQTCLVEERPVGTTPAGADFGLFGGSCSPGPLGASELKVTISAAGDSEAQGVRGLSIVGVAGADVRRVTAVLGNGQVVPLTLTGKNGFQYSVAPSDVATSAAPQRFEAFNNRGAKVFEAGVR